MADGRLAEAPRELSWVSFVSCCSGKNTTSRSSHTSRIAAIVASSSGAAQSTPRISAPIVGVSGRTSSTTFVVIAASLAA